MGVTERRTRQKLALRQQILDAAREVFVKEGYGNVSMRKIAERIEYSPTTIYLHFRDKADLLRCLTEETFGRLAEIMERITLENPDCVMRLRKGLRAYVDFGLRNPNDYKVAFLLEHEPFAHGLLEQDTMAFKAYNFLCSAVRDCIEEGQFRPVAYEVASQALWTSMHGITSLLIIRQQFPWVDREELIECVIENSIRGFLA